MCRIHIHILSTKSVLLDILTVINTHYTQYVHIIHYVHNSMRRCNRVYIHRPDTVLEFKLKCSAWHIVKWAYAVGQGYLTKMYRGPVRENFLKQRSGRS